MTFGKGNLIPNEWEDWFKEEFTFYWEQGLMAKEIYEKMQFNDPPHTPWLPLKEWHVYYFAEKYGLKKRKGKRAHDAKENQEETSNQNALQPWEMPFQRFP